MIRFKAIAINFLEGILRVNYFTGYVLLYLLQFVNPSDIPRLLFLNRYLKNFIDNDQVWKYRVNTEISLYPKLREGQTYKNFYTYLYQHQKYSPYINQKRFTEINVEPNLQGQLAWIEREGTLDDLLFYATQNNAEIWAKRLLLDKSIMLTG